MKKILLLLFIVIIFFKVFPSPAQAVTCSTDPDAVTKCGPLGGCNYTERCTYILGGGQGCFYDPNCPLAPDLCPNNSIPNCLMPGVPLGLVVGAPCPTAGQTCQHQGPPYADPNKCVCRTAITPTASPTPTPTPTPSPTPTPTIPFPTIVIPDIVPACMYLLSKDETIYPPNSACYAEVKRTQSNIETYPKTCIKEPTVSYEDTRGIADQYGYAKCHGVDGSPCDIYITVATDLSQAELGSYGPNYKTLLSGPADTLAKKYLFNSFFDRPYSDSPTTPREAWRTYWRLLPVNEQFNLVAQFINLVNLSNSLDNDTLKQINNTKWQYVDADGNVQETTVKKLAGSLPQCLKIEPVCPNFITVYNNLNTDIKAAYDTLIPLSFNNLRGFIAVSSPSVTETVSRESLPYIETIFAGLLSQKYGLLGNLQPDWLFTKSLVDLTDTNTGYDLSTGKDNYISGQFGQTKFDDDELNVPVLAAADITQCPDYPNVYSLSAPRTFPKSPSNTDSALTQEILIKGSTLSWEIQESPAEYECVGGWEEQCATPGYYDCISPGVWMCRYPAQWTWIEGKRLCMDDEGDLGHKYCSSNSFLKWISPIDCENVCTDWNYVCNSPPEHCSEPPINGSYQQCCQFKVTGTGKGKALTVFNNPKTTDIKQSVIGNSESSLYNTLIPHAFLTPTPIDKKISAPTSSNSLTDTKYTGSGSITNAGSTIYRENNQAQDTVHLIQNCWLVPSDQQSSSKCGSSATSSACLLSEDPLTGACSKTSFAKYVAGYGSSLSPLVPVVSPELSAVYAEAEKQTGVSCVILAAIHFMEANNDPCLSLISGRKLGEPEPDKGGKIYQTLLETAIDAGNELAAKGATSPSSQDIIKALSYYNGNGNANCRIDWSLPQNIGINPKYSIATGQCPPLFPGEDDPYAVSLLDSKHEFMYLRCPIDHNCSFVLPFRRPGAFPVALNYYNSLP